MESSEVKLFWAVRTFKCALLLRDILTNLFIWFNLKILHVLCCISLICKQCRLFFVFGFLVVVGFHIYGLVLDMDKSWIFVTNRLSETYRSGVKRFIEQARNHLDEEGKCRCPCKKCLNCYSHRIDIVERHIFLKGFSSNYVNWINHGEEDPDTPNVDDEEYDAEIGRASCRERV